MNNEYIIVWVAVGAVALVILTAILLNIIEWAGFFSKELRRINGEIERSEGAERRHWQKRKKRLFLSILPFVKY
ncbi:MAG: hypothetical protein IJD22_00730 [Clostridia bacterium]|nr:hypothetical protein [Clostridia bacterium]